MSNRKKDHLEWSQRFSFSRSLELPLQEKFSAFILSKQQQMTKYFASFSYYISTNSNISFYRIKQSFGDFQYLK